MKKKIIKLLAPHETQKVVLKSKARFRVVVCGRRWGKTELGKRAIMRAAGKKHKACWWLAPTYGMASQVWRDLKTACARIEGVRISETERRIDFPGGGWLAIHSAHIPDHLRGAGLDFVVLDEAAFMQPSVWPEVVRPMLLERKGRALFLSSPNGLNWFHDLYQLGLRGTSPSPQVERGSGGEVISPFTQAEAASASSEDKVSSPSPLRREGRREWGRMSPETEWGRGYTPEGPRVSPPPPLTGEAGWGSALQGQESQPAGTNANRSGASASAPPLYAVERGLGGEDMKRPEAGWGSDSPSLLTGRGKGGGVDRRSWRSFTFTSFDNPLIDPAELEAIRAQTPERIFREEYRAEFLADVGQVFRGIRDAATAPLDAQPTPGVRYVLGVDWGRENDATAIVVMDADHCRLVALDRFNQVSWSLQRGRLKAICDHWHPGIIWAESNSIGAPNIEALQNEGLPIRPFVTTAKSKPPLIEDLALAIERGDLALLPDESLLGELASYRMERLPAGGYRYSAPPGLHDDLVIATALAWHGARQSGTLIDFA